METASAAECNSESSTLVVLTSNQDVKHVVIPNSSIGQSKKKHFEIYLINIFFVKMLMAELLMKTHSIVYNVSTPARDALK